MEQRAGLKIGNELKRTSAKEDEMDWQVDFTQIEVNPGQN